MTLPSASEYPYSYRAKAGREESNTPSPLIAQVLKQLKTTLIFRILRAKIFKEIRLIKHRKKSTINT